MRPASSEEVTSTAVKSRPPRLSTHGPHRSTAPSGRFAGQNVRHPAACSMHALRKIDHGGFSHGAERRHSVGWRLGDMLSPRHSCAGRFAGQDVRHPAACSMHALRKRSVPGLCRRNRPGVGVFRLKLNFEHSTSNFNTSMGRTSGTGFHCSRSASEYSTSSCA
jgi:hypothetical protein